MHDSAYSMCKLLYNGLVRSHHAIFLLFSIRDPMLHGANSICPGDGWVASQYVVWQFTNIDQL
jgi:hypothetical protein